MIGKIKKRNSILYHCGNLLILLSLAGFSYIFYPIGRVYLFPPTIQSVLPKTGIYITIPKIRAQAQIQENVDPFNKTEYEQALKKNIAHAQGTSLPGTSGTIYLFAHSSGPPWELTYLNTVFLRISELNKGDIIEIKKKGKAYKYTVREKKEVFPSDVSYLTQDNRDQLILQTCTPIGTDWKRLLVFANPV